MKHKNVLYPPAKFEIVIDTREKIILPFPEQVPTKRDYLYPGDYSIEGLRNQFAVERKSLEDLINSLIGYKDEKTGRRYNRERLVEELSAMADFQYKCVIITSPRAKLEGHYYQSRVDPANVIGMIGSIEARTGVQFKFYASPEEAARWVAIEAYHFWRYANGLSNFKPKIHEERLKPRKIKMPKPPSAK